MREANERLADNDTTTKPFGPVAAVFTAAGIGAVVLGILTTLTEASASIKDALQLNDRVGPLSGKTIFAVLVVPHPLGGVPRAVEATRTPLRGRSSPCPGS